MREETPLFVVTHTRDGEVRDRYLAIAAYPGDAIPAHARSWATTETPRTVVATRGAESYRACQV